MSCHSCAAKFGFLKKELGCPVCGFAFCGKCLKYEGKGLKPSDRVCRSCSQKLDTDKSSSSATQAAASDMDFKPPDIFLRRLETLEDPSRPPVTVYSQNPPSTLQSFQVEANPPPSEQEIRGRLQKLRQRLTAAPSVEEMEERLAKLQKMPLNKKSYSVDMAARPVSSEEQTCNLVEQMTGEAGLERQHTNYSRAWQEDIEARLARLKGQEEAKKPEETIVEKEVEDDTPEGLLQQITSKMSTSKAPPLPADEESELEIVNRILAEVALEENLEDSDGEGESEVEEPISEAMEEELPWCCICNEDASLRCPGCAGDLFCARCYREGHDVCDMRDHKPTPFQHTNPA